MSTTLFKNARILTEDGVIENGQVVVEYDHKEYVQPKEGEKPVKVKPSFTSKITYIGTEYTGQTDEEIDVAGNTILPGLIDADARLDTLHPDADDYVDNIGIAYRTFIAWREAAEALNSGVTTIKAVGMPNNIDIALKTAFSKGMYFGPTVLATGPIFGVHGGKGHEKYGMLECSGTDQFRAAIRTHIARGLEGVTFQLSGDKMHSLNGEFRPEMTSREIEAMTKQAAGAEKPVAVNASGDASVRMAIDAGVHVIQQGYRISEALLKEMAEKNIWYVPCLVSTLGTELEEEHMSTVRKAIKAGVKIVVGTEILPSQPVDGVTAIIKEIELLAACGMSAADALKAATSDAAKCIHANAGVIKEGKAADFVIVGGKPEEDIKAMRNLVCVVRAGRRVFNKINGCKERLFHPHAPLYEVSGGNTIDWTKNAVQGVKEPENFNVSWNLNKEI